MPALRGGHYYCSTDTRITYAVDNSQLQQHAGRLPNASLLLCLQSLVSCQQRCPPESTPPRPALHRRSPARGVRVEMQNKIPVCFDDALAGGLAEGQNMYLQRKEQGAPTTLHIMHILSLHKTYGSNNYLQYKTNTCVISRPYGTRKPTRLYLVHRISPVLR